MQEGRPTPASPSLLGLGVAWTRVGYGVLFLSALAFVLWHTVHPVLPFQKGAATPTGYRLLSNKDGGMFINATGLGIASIAIMVFSSLAGFVWTLVDIVDRRKRFVWLLPMFICPLVMSLQALPLALYLFFARETIGHGEGVG